ncbi:MAG: arsenic transporter [Faecalibacterium sp.]|nr:arsenic transporter [Faecalibacterium sp.]
MNPLVLAAILFVATYVLLLALSNYRHIVALVGAASFVLVGILPVGNLFGAIDWNVLLMIAGSMGLVQLFIDSGMPALMANVMLRYTKTVRITIVALALFAGIISAFIDNVATVLMVAPIALAVSRRVGISPVPVVISVAVSSNLQGAATLVGDTTSILLGAAAGMDFMDFFWYNGKPGMFWVVQAGAVASAVILYFLFRNTPGSVEPAEDPVVENKVPTILLLAMVALLAGASAIPNKPDITNGLICCVLMVVGIVYETMRGNKEAVKSAVGAIDWQTLLLLAGVFIVVAGVEAAGVLEVISGVFAGLGGGNLFIIYAAIVWGSVLCSAFIDNIPYTAAMLPVVENISSMLGINPTLLYFGLLCGATLGGNLTPVGASANITGIGILRKEGYEVKNSDFLKIGVPFTLSAVITGFAILWVLWA